MNELVVAVVVGYWILPVAVACVLVFVHWDYHPGNGDLAGAVEVGVPMFILYGIHVAAYTLHFLAAMGLAGAELVFISVVVEGRRHRETKTQERAERRKRATFAERVGLPPNDPIIDCAYVHLTEEARKSIKGRAALAALLGERAEEKQKEQRRKRLFNE